MSHGLCALTSLVGGLAGSWRSFKLLKRRDEINRLLLESSGSMEEPLEDEEEVLNLKCEMHLTKKEMKEILKFWTVFALLSLFEMYLEVFVFWIPFYYTFKFVVLLWMVGPQSKGSETIFESIVAPYLDRQDEWVNQTLLPTVYAVQYRTQKSVSMAYINLVTSMGTDSALEDVEDHLEFLIERIQEEKLRRMNGEKSGKRLSPPSSPGHLLINEDTDPRVLENIALMSERKSENKTSTLSYFSSWFTSTTSSSQSQDVQKTADGVRGARSGSMGWMLNAFDGVAGVTMHTRDLLLGTNNNNNINEDAVNMPESKIPQEDDDNLTTEMSPEEKDAFDNLSAYDDDDDDEEEDEDVNEDNNYGMKHSSSSTFSSYVDLMDVEISEKAKSSTTRKRTARHTSSSSSTSDSAKSRELPQSPEQIRRRQRPATRSQTQSR